MELMQEQILEQVAKREKPGKITENTFTEDEPLAHHSTHNRGRCCLVCKHWTAPRDLRQERLSLVVLGKGHCRFGEKMCVEGVFLSDLQQQPHSCKHACPKFEKIPELRARNMTLIQRCYARMPPCKPRRRQDCNKTHAECPLADCVCKTQRHAAAEKRKSIVDPQINTD